MNSRQGQISRSNGFGWRNADAYLFDIDGTLLVTNDGVHRAAIHQAMREVYGVETTIDGVAYHGKTDLGILRAALERAGIRDHIFEAGLNAALEVVRREVSANAGRIAPKVFADVPALLALLNTAGKLLGVASGNLETVGWHKLEAAGLRSFFSFGCFSDQREKRADIFAEALNESRRRLGMDTNICFVGDTPEDIRAAQHVNAHIIAVCTGIFKAEELNPLGPDVCVGSCSDLLSTLANGG